MASRCPKCHEWLDEDYICCSDIEFTWQCKSCKKLTKGFVIPFGHCNLCGGELEIIQGYKGAEDPEAVDIIRNAAQFEVDHYLFYKNMGQYSSDKDIKALFEKLSMEELHHVLEIENKYHLHFDKDFTNANSLDYGEIMGVEIKPEGITPMLLLEKAMGIEKNAQNFYEEEAGNSKSAKIRELYQQLAAEEKEHYFLIKSFIDKKAIY